MPHPLVSVHVRVWLPELQLDQLLQDHDGVHSHDWLTAGRPADVPQLLRSLHVRDWVPLAQSDQEPHDQFGVHDATSWHSSLRPGGLRTHPDAQLSTLAMRPARHRIKSSPSPSYPRGPLSPQ